MKREGEIQKENLEKEREGARTLTLSEITE